ncbi:putative SAM-dependent methyltransferase [Sulfolobales Beppu filamentous virus 3]|uniref:Putative SAM-dependent methyltransferase n=1 Tax=Sulfolobales Beppu filamentous virus 3 TaxID=2493124 RepID=A0A3Q8Q3U7_9VIRU|nr:SAM-dependent methyltransferase [Sulfolobales Beppu filamentous virus 3]AZI75855.1 putative SAM-dependent methyltransferase [Sulfolobales Beppu filamentous virus 3]
MSSNFPNYRKYFSDRGCDYWYEYDNSYGFLDVKGKKIVIVGADCGSSALYFLLHGAVYIIQYEKDEERRKRWDEVCRYFNICDKAVMNGEWNNEYPDADVFIMDCEGCESSLDVDKLSKYTTWCIAVHQWTQNRVELLRKLIRYGVKLRYVSDDGNEIMVCST